MKNWEYYIHDQEIDIYDPNCGLKIINEFGSEGWEIVSIIKIETYYSSLQRFYFKRSKQLENKS